jgi:non-lysosomal glucosylceramidase
MERCFSVLIVLAFSLGFASIPVTAADDWRADWPVLRTYDRDHVERIALPLGGIGTGTVSLGGRGNLLDWEIMNRPAKGYVPCSGQQTGPFFAVRVADGETVFTRALEGPLPLAVYEASHGSTAVNHGLPRFREAAFAAAYPLGQVRLSDPDAPVDVRLEAWNPLVPGDAETSGIPVAVLRYVLVNKTLRPLRASVCGTLPNFIGADGSELGRDWKSDPVTTGPKKNRNEFRSTGSLRGVLMRAGGIDPRHEAWGTIALTAAGSARGSSRTSWLAAGWGTSLLDFWDDFAADGVLDPRPEAGEDMPFGSLTVELDVPAGGSAEAVFYLTWHFPNRRTWSPKGTPDDVIGNYYTTKWADAWAVAEDVAARAADLEARTVAFVRAFASSSLPLEVKEAALFNLSTLRTQTCFRTPDGRFFGFEGSSNNSGCCWGSCTHVWNYEQATAFLFGGLARSMRETEFLEATDAQGLMSFRVRLPIDRAREYGKAAADGQMGTIMKAYREWKMSGDDAWLRKLWPSVKRALAFAWIPGGWDADRDGVMEGCQHNTMDVEYYGPNPQMGLWYLGALRAAEEMARRTGDKPFAELCRGLFEKGRARIDANLWNGEYYEHKVKPPRSVEDVAPSLRLDMGAKDITEPDYQLAEGCLVDQLVGQYMAHVCGLGYLVDPAHVRTALASVLKYNTQRGFFDHFNCLRSFVLGDETALLMASYPKGRPRNPFPYFTEVMTGFEYTAAVGLLYEGEVARGLEVIRNVRARYDGKKRSPFDEAECGHHYARAMASWAAVPALSGFSWDGAAKAMAFNPVVADGVGEGTFFWSNGDAWGTCRVGAGAKTAEFAVLHGALTLRSFRLGAAPARNLKRPAALEAGGTIELRF